MEKVIIPSSSIPKEGMEEIFKVLEVNEKEKEEILTRVLPEWIITKGEFAGSFPKRLYKFYSRNYGVKLSEEILGKVGNIAKQYTLQKTYYVELDRDLWNPGKFGDENSCFWGNFKFAKTFIFLLGGKAMKIYSENRAPISRCWVIPWHKNFVIFNQYSTRNLRLIFSARILAYMLNFSYEKISLELGNIYINRNEGFFISPWEEKFSEGNFYDYIEGKELEHSCGKIFKIMNAAYVHGNENLFCPHCGEIIAEE